MTIIRPYQSYDRQRVFEIAADTAFFGDKVENFMEDRSLFCDAFCTYYTDYESEHAWVAEENGVVIGYLLGCTDTYKQSQIIQKHILPHLIQNFVLGGYKIGRLTLHYGYGLLLARIRRQSVHADIALYPAHFHLNIAQENRGGGLGRGLLEVFLGQILKEGVNGIHLKTTSENIAACALYEKLKFHIIDRKITSLWRYWLHRDIENRCYGLLLASSSAK
ncbi:MAG: GNAT family N-acetyltransferase [Anaerolineales bacterium]